MVSRAATLSQRTPCHDLGAAHRFAGWWHTRAGAATPERLGDPLIGQGGAANGDEQGRGLSPDMQAVAHRHVAAQCLGRRRLQGDEPRLPRLGLAERQQSLLEIDIGLAQGQGLADAQARRDQQTEQGHIGVRAHAGTQGPSGREERRDFGRRIDVGGLSAKCRTEQTGRRHLRVGIAQGPTQRGEKRPRHIAGDRAREARADSTVQGGLSPRTRDRNGQSSPYGSADANSRRSASSSG